MSEGFDLRTHIRDTKSGKVIQKQPYRLTIISQGPGQTLRIYERDGQKFYENGEPYVEAVQAAEVVEAPVQVKVAPAVAQAAKAAAPAQAAVKG